MTAVADKPIFDAVRRLLRGRGAADNITEAEFAYIKAAIEQAFVGEPLSKSGFANPTRPSKRGIALMHQFEGCKLDAYPDPGSSNGDPWTIGWGATGPGISRGVRWTQEQADARFEEDLARFAIGVVRLLGSARTTQPQFDALVSFAYNVGLSALERSTLLRKHKAGDYAGAAAEFGRWNKNDGDVMRGLTRRRAAEADLYRSGP